MMSTHLLFCQPQYMPSLVEIRSQLAWEMHTNTNGTWTVKNWMQYSASHVATIPLCFCPKIASAAILEHLIPKNFVGEHPLRPPQSSMLMHTYKSHIHVTPFLKFQATGLRFIGCRRACFYNSRKEATVIMYSCCMRTFISCMFGSGTITLVYNYTRWNDVFSFHSPHSPCTCCYKACLYVIQSHHCIRHNSAKSMQASCLG